MKLVDYPNESDPGPYPVPDNAPIENWPLAVNEDQERAARSPARPSRTCSATASGDRHMIVVDPVNGKLYEFWQSRKTDDGWQASNEATFDLKTGALRPERWTSSDAAGLPIFPAVVRYDECERGMVEHAMRFTVRRTRRGYVLPATHWASPHFDKSYPRMGERFRLKASFDTSGYPKHARAILEGLKKYGMLVADNGSDWLMSISPDRRLEGLETLQAGEGLGLRGGGDRRARGRGRAEVSRLAMRLCQIGCGEHARVAHGPSQARCARERGGPRARRLLRPRRGARGVLPPRLRLRPRLRRPRRPCSRPSGPTPWSWSCRSSGRWRSGRWSSSGGFRFSSRSRPARRWPRSTG